MGELSIHLLGTIHDDPIGFSRLEKALEVEKPDIITVETNEALFPSIAEYKKRVLELLDQELAKRKLRREVVDSARKTIDWYDFEYQVAKKYSSLSGVPVHFVDTSVGLESFIVEDKVRLSMQNIHKIRDPAAGNQRALRSAEKQYAEIDAIIARGGILLEYPMTDQIIQDIMDRDGPAARNILEAGKSGGKLVHICGCMHMLRDRFGETIYSRLRQHVKSRRTIANPLYA